MSTLDEKNEPTPEPVAPPVSLREVLGSGGPEPISLRETVYALDVTGNLTCPGDSRIFRSKERAARTALGLFLNRCCQLPVAIRLTGAQKILTDLPEWCQLDGLDPQEVIRTKIQELVDSVPENQLDELVAADQDWTWCPDWRVSVLPVRLN